MLLSSLPALIMLVAATLATPYNQTAGAKHNLEKRASPSIGQDFTEQQRSQILEALIDARHLVNSVDELDYEPEEIAERIRPNFFVPKDYGVVEDVFKKILEAMDAVGNSKLSKLAIVTDYADPRRGCHPTTCYTPKFKAELREADTENPKIVLCDIVFVRGHINKGDPLSKAQHSRDDALPCDKFDDHLSMEMAPLGATLLHEYTHHADLLSPRPMPQGTTDYSYGPYQVQLEYPSAGSEYFLEP